MSKRWAIYIAHPTFITVYKGVDKLVDLYEITEMLKRFNEMLNEVGGSL